MHVWHMLHVVCWKYRRRNSPSAQHLGTTLSSCIFATKAYIDNRKQLVKQQYFLTRHHNMVNFGPLTAEIGWRLWGTSPANFNEFRVLALLLHQPLSAEVNQSLHNVWLYPGWYTIYILRALAPERNFARCKIHFVSKSCVLLYWQLYWMAL